MTGLIHIYCGDGKGKTTAATGLAIRAFGAGKKVLFVQFLKDGSSSEIKILKEQEFINTSTLCSHQGFFYTLSEEERDKMRNDYTKMFNDVLLKIQNDKTDLLVLDEVIVACNLGIIEENRLIEFLKKKPDTLEVVLTGRGPSEKLLFLADYVTEMKKVKHPYDKGIIAREGIEL